MLMEFALEEISFGGTYFHDLCKTRFWLHNGLIYL